MRVNPTLDWSREDVVRYMKANDLPFHKLAKHDPARDTDEIDKDGLLPSYTY